MKTRETPREYWERCAREAGEKQLAARTSKTMEKWDRERRWAEGELRLMARQEGGEMKTLCSVCGECEALMADPEAYCSDCRACLDA